MQVNTLPLKEFVDGFYCECTKLQMNFLLCVCVCTRVCVCGRFCDVRYSSSGDSRRFEFFFYRPCFSLVYIK